MQSSSITNGGARTDNLVSNLKAVNPDSIPIHILDNGSDPDKRSQFITHETGANLGIGGGINHCLQLAEQEGARRLCLIINDLNLSPAGVPIPLLEYPFAIDDQTVAVSASITPESNQALLYPWVIQHQGRQRPYRPVPHADFLFIALDLRFIHDIGGFPDHSTYARGFDLHFAHQARLRGKKIYVCDDLVAHHTKEDSLTSKESTSYGRYVEMVERFYDFYDPKDWRNLVPYPLQDKYDLMYTGLKRMMQMTRDGAPEQEIREIYNLIHDLLSTQEAVARMGREKPNTLFR